MSKTLLEINNLAVDFLIRGSCISAVEQATLAVAEQETVVLAGESGSGKTVTAMAVTRILAPGARIRAGSIRYRGQELRELDERSLAALRGSSIAYIFQEPTSFLNPVMTIGSQITEAIRVHRQIGGNEVKAEALSLLTKVRLDEPDRVFHSYPHQLSGGMNQRAMIAMALALRPQLLIADEPTTALDVTTEAQILGLLTELKSQIGFSLLFITHNLAIARRIAQRIYVMYRGRVVEAGDTEAIFHAPAHAHTRELLAAYERIGKV